MELQIGPVHTPLQHWHGRHVLNVVQQREIDGKNHAALPHPMLVVDVPT
jgi:hypothetical protein